MADRIQASGLTGRRVLVLGAEENPVLPVLKSLGRQGVHLSCASHLWAAPGLHSRYTSAALRCPDPWEDEDAFVSWALPTCESGKFDLVIPLGERPSYWVARQQERFKAFTRVPFPDLDTYMIGRDKALTMKAANRLGVPIPETFYPEDEPIASIASRCGYPAVIKPRIGYGARGIFFPKSKEELIGIFPRAEADFGKCIIQEFIPQDGMQYKVESVQDNSRSVKAIGVYSKPRYFPPTGGSSTLNITVDRPDICELAARYLEGIGWFGMGDCDFIEDPRDGIVKMMEQNPRFTRSIRILVEAGLDFPVMLVRAVLGEDLPVVSGYASGLHMRYLLPDCMWFVKSRERWKARPSFFRFFGKDVIYEMLSLHDPLPSSMYLLSNAGRLLSTGTRRRLLRRG